MLFRMPARRHGHCTAGLLSWLPALTYPRRRRGTKGAAERPPGLCGEVAAVDPELGAGDVGGLVRRQHQRLNDSLTGRRNR
jgi:hypothetical protein